MNSQDVLLGLLMNQPLSGYEMKNQLHLSFVYFYDASFGTIYPTLTKLESGGYITKESIEQENRPNKNVYSISDKGRRRFMEYMNSPLEDESYRSDFMIRMYFGEHQDLDKLIDWVRASVDQCREEVEMLTTNREQWTKEISATQLICLNTGIALNEAKGNALEEGLERLLEMKKQQIKP